ncbi:phosphoenolpyruvate--protein phosphotransferase [Puniceicoccaceae bacterium K14]|nr:phosphoenolpyruvate--protein phosphotransferase [Puniceicoccaceae bacterium K14]
MDANLKQEKRFKGIAASPGIAHGCVLLLAEEELTVPRYRVEGDAIENEIQRFENALLETRGQIQSIQEKIRQNLGEDEARIFDAHLLVLEDQALIEESIKEMQEHDLNVEAAVWTVGHRYIEAFGQIDDEYLRERASDLRDVLRRLLSNLTGQALEQIGTHMDDRILVSNDVSPSAAANIDRSKLLGIVTNAGSKTSHAVIMARSMEVPAVVGLGSFTDEVDQDDIVLVDGYEGVVILNPSESTLHAYGKLKDEKTSLEERLLVHSREASTTKDGKEILLMANIETAEEASRSLEFGADGVGLFRTEYLFINADSLPTEDEQFEVYSKTAKAMAGKPVVFRTLDLGGDKMPRESMEMSLGPESNPFLGYRAIRYCLDHDDVFIVQLRALLRSSVHGDVRIMYPMISGSAELKDANQILEDAKSQLRSEGVAFNESVKVGTMIEIPSAAIASDTLVADSDFFSIGTNDLIQYLIAVDRLNDRVAHLYEPTHPAVIRTLDNIVSSARRGDLSVSVCGEVAGDPVMVPLLLGLGIENLSMSPSLLPSVKFVVQNMSMEEAERLGKMALAEPDSTKILENLLDYYTDLMSGL